MTHLRGPFKQFKLDLPVLRLFGGGNPTAVCLKRCLREILDGGRALEKAAVGQRIYWIEDCGYRLWLVHHPKAFAIHVVAVELAPETEP